MKHIFSFTTLHKVIGALLITFLMIGSAALYKAHIVEKLHIAAQHEVEMLKGLVDTSSFSQTNLENTNTISGNVELLEAELYQAEKDIEYSGYLLMAAWLVALIMSCAVVYFVKKDIVRFTRIQSALDVTNTNVMMADSKNVIVYMNHSVVKMLQAAEEDIRKDLPHFDANNLTGQLIDVFHKNPSHQRSMLEHLTHTYEANIKVGGRTFNLIANPIHNAFGKRLGTVVEWQDITKRIEEEVLKKEQDAREVYGTNYRCS